MRLLRAAARRAFSIASAGHVRVGRHRFLRRRFLPSNLHAAEVHEPWLDRAFAAALRSRAGAVIDVGVNVGQTLFKVLEIDREREYVGFEPQTGPCFFVEQFIAENGLRHHRVLPIALSDQPGVLHLHIRGSGYASLSSSTASVIHGFRPENFYDFSKAIYAARGDDVIPNLGLGSIALIKIDVEGAELEVLQGLSESIARHRPSIVFEVLNHYLVVTGERLAESMVEFRERRLSKLESFLRERNYRILQIQGDGSARDIARIEPQRAGDLTTTDYIAIPDECAEGFSRELDAGR